jgi:3',5'-cyclic AMP phosphodiesterase CpdA
LGPYDTVMISFSPIEAESNQANFRLAHISDPHLSSLNDISWRLLANKRILGYLSWRLSRRFIHRLDVLNSLIGDLDSTGSNHLVISGDLTHIGTPSECEQVSTWLAQLGNAKDITVIPGNHDCYIKDNETTTIGRWSAYMHGDAALGSSQHPVFPSFRKRGPLAIIGLSTALPTAPFFASGRLGDKQIDTLAQLLKQTEQRGLFRVVVLHHGPLSNSNKFQKRLTDAAQFRSVIQSCGAELILHGHSHYPVYEWLQGKNSKVPVLGAASASILSKSTEKRAGYNIYNVNTTESGWRVQVESRRYDSNDATFEKNEILEFTLPRNIKA